MDIAMDKENIADGLLASFGEKPAQSPPKKALKKSRAASIGPGALSNNTLKVDFGNRRKSVMPIVKSILPGGEDEAKRRADRRKSLANRRVSFAPEATLHTWDVVEYMKDATTSSASSENTRHTSGASEPSTPAGQSSPLQADLLETASPATPPEQAESPAKMETPESQRKAHQKQRRRRSSGVPPMNFNNPDEDFSSSPYNEDSPLGSDPIELQPEQSDSDSESGDDNVSITMDLDEATAQSIASAASVDSTSSSARLDEALRQAARHAGAQETIPDDGGEMTMDLADDEVTNAFKPWVQKAINAPARPQFAEQDKENEDPFRSAPKFAPKLSEHHDLSAIEEETQELSMDITRAVGGILAEAAKTAQPAFVVAQDQENNAPSARGNKRRQSLAPETTSQGSPAKRQTTRRTSVRRRRSSAVEDNVDDATMDFTMAVGGIKAMNSEHDRRQSIDNSMVDDTMDFTMVVGGFQKANLSKPILAIHEDEADEDMSMELTTTLDKTIVVNAQKMLPAIEPVLSIPATPVQDRPALQVLASKSPVESAIKAAATPGAAVKAVTPTRRSSVSPRKSPRKQSRLSIAAELVAAESQTVAAASPKAPSTPLAQALLKAEEQQRAFSVDDRVISTPLRELTVNRLMAQAPSMPLSQEEETTKSLSISDSIKLMSTPNKKSNSSPVKRVFGVTPQKHATPKKPVPAKKSTTPKKMAAVPKKQVYIDPAIPDEAEVVAETQVDSEQSLDDVERITLQDFLSLTNIKFMDLTTTKRRHTGYPGADAKLMDEDDETPVERPTLENNVAVAVGVVPMLSMYQHCCHEMKNYINGGRAEIKNLEAEAFEVQPPLFREYMSATPEVRLIMDNQFKNMKTNARLQSKSGWHTWRSQLLNDLRMGLQQTAADLVNDEDVLSKQEAIIAGVLPDLEAEEAQLQQTEESLLRRKAEMESEDREVLDEARAQLVAVEEAIALQKQQFDALQRDLADKTELVETIKEQKEETVAETREAERVSEACRGWSVQDVVAAKDALTSIESEHGWRLTSADNSTSSVTLTYLSDLQLYLSPSAFLQKSASGASEVTTPNAPISLSYIGDSDTKVSASKQRPLTDSKRFFLQLLRAHLQSTPQSLTPLKSILSTISSGWDAALSVAEAIRRLEQICMVDERILGDEKLGIDAILLLPSVQTKVRARFEIATTCSCDAVDTEVKVEVNIVYGEKYDEGKMATFLLGFVGGLEKGSVGSWAEGVEDLKARLVKRGPKGNRL